VDPTAFNGITLSMCGLCKQNFYAKARDDFACSVTRIILDDSSTTCTALTT